ncbi:hypothetical protein EDD29_1260 [Actinocorallia herbida]|uniref:Protein kinase domain-containing protein n=1 Tax=Actinocorallia herbida TaxID=58109 RepID=A0A3N1CR11_9ACTN|nr:molecular chaperone DnaJ [Actinocorallia herbida]ROO83751.1 hypothetical protein EDD29_1260 [Actinocorallia herbida]
MTPDEALALLDRPAAEIFGADEREARRRYHRLARLLHPDTGADATAFARLTAKWHAHTGGTVLTTRRGAYRVGARVARGDVADLFAVEDLSGAGGGLLLKLPRDPADSDLMDREATALRRLAERGDPRYLPYVPRLVESIKHDGRRGAILSRDEGFHTLAEVAAARPGGLDPRDAAWMWRRLLVVLGFAHRAGVVHGAVLPGHVMIHPEMHGLVLVGWGQSVTDPPGRVPLMVDAYAADYPPEIVAREPVTAAADVFLATRCMTALMGPLLPPPMRAFARGCTQPSPRLRPADAWALLGELDELLDRMYGPRVFRPFTL